VGDGHGGFGAGTLVNPEPVGGIFTFLGLQDINHDNFADAVFWVTSSGSTYAAVSFLLGSSNGLSGAAGSQSFSIGGGTSSGPNSWATLADFDGDGNPDLYIRSIAPEICCAEYLAKNNGNGSFQTQYQLTNYVTSPANVAASFAVLTEEQSYAVPLGNNKVALMDSGGIGVLADSGPAYYLDYYNPTFGNLVSIDFGSMMLPLSGTPNPISILLLGVSGFEFSSVTAQPPVTVTTSQTAEGISIAPGVNISVSVTPEQAGPIDSSITLTSNAPGSPFKIPVFGYAGTPAF
jgi:hypothetical protein